MLKLMRVAARLGLRGRRGIAALMLSIVSIISGTQVSAAVPAQFRNGLVDASYQVLSADINSDGQTDFLLRARNRIVLIDYEIVIPVLLRWRDNFVLLSNPSGNPCGSGYQSGGYCLISGPSADLLNNPAWQAGTHELIFGDTDGDGSDEMLIRALTPNGTSLLIETSETNGLPQVRQKLSYPSIGVDLGETGLDVDLLDTNGDGRADILTGTPYGLVKAILRADGQGTFSYEQEQTSPTDETLGREVGSTAGTFTVTPTGASSYTIPISVVPGLGGIEPKLAISYNAEGGDGLLGPKFALEGMSQITRCPATPGQDGAYAPIAFTASDKFCLDGGRLVKSPTTGKYRTELESFSDIESFGTDASNPTYWRVRTKAGLHMEFGGAVTSCSAGNVGKVQHASYSNKAASWLITKVKDTSGNWMEFCYQKDATTGETWPSTINYTGSTGVTPFASVSFVTKVRAGLVPVGYDNAQMTNRSRILDRVETYFEGQRVRAYKLQYEMTGLAERNIVTRVQECAGPSFAERCLPATTFKWSAPTEGVDPRQTYTAPVGLANYQHSVGDWNADGYTDIFSTIIESDGRMSARVLRSTSTATAISFSNSSSGLLSHGINNSSFIGARTAVGDFNGDGRADIAVVNIKDSLLFHSLFTSASGQATTAIFNAAASSSTAGGGANYVMPSSNIRVQAANLNGDAIDDLLIIHQAPSTGIWVQALLGKTTGGFEPKTKYQLVTSYSGLATVVAGDFNADGITDAAIYYPGSTSTIRVWLRSPSGTYSAKPAATIPVGQGGDVVLLTDFNADGNADLLLLSPSTIDCSAPQDLHANGENSIQAASVNPSDCHYMADGQITTHLGKGNGSFSYAGYYDTGNYEPGHNVPFVTREVFVGDYNGDGVNDVMMHGLEHYGTQILHGKPDGSLSMSLNATTLGGESNLAFLSGDFNGDGKFDASSFLTTGSTSRLYVLKAKASLPAQLQRIVNGTGSEVEIEQSPLTNTVVYSLTADGTAAPCGGVSPRVLCGPIYVTSRVTYTNTSANTSRYVNYTYDTARMDPGGRGFLGFRQVKTTDGVTSNVEQSTYKWDWPYIGAVEKTEVKTGTGASISSVITEYGSQKVVDATTGPDSWFAAPIYQTSQTWEVGEFATATPYITEVEKTVYGESSGETTFYGNATETARFVCAGNVTRANCESSPVYATTTANGDWLNDTTNWLLGRVKTTVVTHQAPGTPTLTRNSVFGYDPTSGLLTVEQLEPNNSTLELRLKTVHGRDAYGNIETETIEATTSSGPAIRDSSNVYLGGSPHYNRFKTQSCNALQHCSNATFNGATGQPVVVTDANLLSKSFGYDPFGRKELELFQEPQTGITQISTVTRRWCRGDCEPNAGAKYAIETSSNTGAYQETQYDSEEREVVKITRAADGALLKVKTTYDAAGRVLQQTLPYSASVNGYIEYTYDVLGRALTQKDAAGNVTKNQYKGLTSVSIDERGKSSTRLSNLIGLVSRSTDALNGKVDYGYDALGNLTSTVDPGESASADSKRATTTLVYDIRGRKTSQSDPSMGTWSYQYDGFGDLVQQTDAKSQVTTFIYDKLGRMIQRREAEGLTKWHYDTVSPDNSAYVWKGALTWVEQRVDSNNNGQLDQTDAFLNNRVLTYNKAGLVATTTESVGNQGYQFRNDYDDKGRLLSLTYPSGFKVHNRYNAQGAVDQVSSTYADGTVGSVYWTASSWDRWGSVSDMQFGNGLHTNTTRDPFTGRLTDISTGTGVSGNIQSLHYVWDEAGNLKERRDSRPELGTAQLIETFDYDDIGRFTKAYLEIPGVLTKSNTQSATYYPNGNVKTKTGTSSAGTYAYTNASKPLLLSTSTTSTRVYSHDDNGNMTQYTQGGSVAATYSWSSYNMPTSLIRNSKTVQFTYGPDRQRLTQNILGSGKSVAYVGGLYEVHTTGSQVQKKHFVNTPVGTVAIFTLSGTSKTNEYVHRDHLGSVDVLTSSPNSGSAAVIERSSFDVFGKRRGAGWQGSAASSFSTSRGFTGHEMLDSVGLIHMNGRVYDPLIGRFLSPDPHIQNPNDTQSHNRFAYTQNQYLNATDPSGFFLKKFIKKHWRTMFAIAFAAYGGYAISMMPGISTLGALAISGTAGFAGAMVTSGGDLRAGLIGAATAMAFYGIGTTKVAANATWGRPETLIPKALAHGLAGAVSSYAQGEGFARGFLTTGISAYFAPGIDSAIDSHMLSIGTAAILGGTLAELGGGKFANGAVSSAFSYALNQRQQRRNVLDTAGEEVDRMLTIKEIGRDGEILARNLVLERGYIIVGEQVYIETLYGTRIVDILALKGGELTAFEVKANFAMRSSIQILKDESIAVEGGKIISKSFQYEDYKYGSYVKFPTGEVRVFIRPAPPKLQ